MPPTLGIRVRVPRPGLCTDNGAMVAALGAEMVARGRTPSALDLPADSQPAGDERPGLGDAQAVVDTLPSTIPTTTSTASAIPAPIQSVRQRWVLIPTIPATMTVSVGAAR